MMLRTASLVFAVWFAGSAALAQGAQTADCVRLSEVAQVQGDAGETCVAERPGPGMRLALDPDLVAKIAFDAGAGAIALPNGPIWVETGSDTAIAIPTYAPSKAQDDAQAGPADHVLTLSRSIAKGDIIAADDLVWRPLDGARLPSQAILDPEALIGQEARRNLRVGASLRVFDVQAERLVRKGETVTLVYSAPGLRVTAEGRAVSDGAYGETVRVINTESNRTLEAVALAPGEAHIRPGA